MDSQAPVRHGWMFWALVIAGTAVALFFGSAYVAGRMEQAEERAFQQKAASLAPTTKLLGMIMASQAATPKTPLVCRYIGAIGYRLAEARDLKISKQEAVDLANDEHLVREIASHGFNARDVIYGIASHVYDSPLSPQATFETQQISCARGGR